MQAAEGVQPQRLRVQYVGRLAGWGRLPWLPTGRLGGATTRVYGGRRSRSSPQAGAGSCAEPFLLTALGHYGTC
jgi:hypothetical protein